MPNRIIRESICGSESVDRLTVDEERFFYRLILQVDDYGRIDGRPSFLRSRCFPIKDGLLLADISGWLLSLAREELIRLYQVDGKPYLYFVNWAKYQRIRATNSKYPNPHEQNDSESPTNDSESPPDAPVVVVENRSRSRESRIVDVIPPVVPQGTLPEKEESKQFKTTYGTDEFLNVSLTAGEHGKLVAKFGLQGATDWIHELSLAKASKGYKSKSDYATILAWARRREKLGTTGGNFGRSNGDQKPDTETPEQHMQRLKDSINKPF